MREIIYNGLGFPIRLKCKKIREFRGEILPEINHRELEDAVFKRVLWMPAHFSGTHLAFIRGYMGLSQKAFATLLGLKTHATVSAWEAKREAATGMPPATEVIIRLLMADFIRDKTFPSHFKDFLGITNSTEDLELQVG